MALSQVENNIPFQEKIIQVAKGQTRDAEFAKINPARQVPVVQFDDGLVLVESHTILRYLAQKYRVADHWYPADPIARAKVDSVLDWHHTHTRYGAAMTFRYHVLYPMLKPGYQADASRLKETKRVLDDALSTLEGWLSQHKYVASNEISIADLSLGCEIAQLESLKENLLSPYPHVVAWYERLHALQHWAAVHKILRVIVSRVGGVGYLGSGGVYPGSAPAVPAAAAPAAASAPSAAGGEFKSARVFDLIRKKAESQGAELVAKINAVYQFNVTNAAGATKSWVVDLKNGSGSVTEGTAKADTTLTVKDDDFVAMNTGKLDSQSAFMQGKLKIAGSMGHAMKLNGLLAQVASL